MAYSKNFTLLISIAISSLMVASASNFYQDFDITWGDGRGKILNNGQLLSLSLDKASGSGFQSKSEYLFGKIDMQLKLVPGNSAGTVTAYYVSFGKLDNTHTQAVFLINKRLASWLISYHACMLIHIYFFSFFCFLHSVKITRINMG